MILQGNYVYYTLLLRKLGLKETEVLFCGLFKIFPKLPQILETKIFGVPTVPGEVKFLGQLVLLHTSYAS